MATPDDETYRNVRKRVHEERLVYQHMTVYAAVMLLLFLINLNSGSSWWIQWPAMGWGLLLVLHGAFATGGLFGSEWERKRVAELTREKPPR